MNPCHNQTRLAQHHQSRPRSKRVQIVWTGRRDLTRTQAFRTSDWLQNCSSVVWDNFESEQWRGINKQSHSQTANSFEPNQPPHLVSGFYVDQGFAKELKTKLKVIAAIRVKANL